MLTLAQHSTFQSLLTSAASAASTSASISTVPHISSVTSTALQGISSIAMAGEVMTSSAPVLVSVCSKLAPWAAIAVSAAPIPTLQQVANDKDTGTLPLLPYSSMVVNAFVWMIYGLLIREKKVWLTNAVGSSMGLFYCRKFSKYCKTPPAKQNLPGTMSTHLFGASFLMLFTSAMASMMPVQQASKIVGLMGVVFCVILFASPLSSLKEVVATKSAKSIPLPFCLVACVNTAMWSVVGWFEMNDFMIYAPNLLGLAFSLAQVALKLVYGNGGKQHKQGGAGIAMTTPRGGGFNLPV